jgi:hypothetical protein
MHRMAFSIAVLALVWAMGSTPSGAWEPGKVPGKIPFPAPTLLAFGTMYGVDGPFIGEANSVRGVPGDELPWEIGPVTGRLGADGRLFLLVKGLVFKDDPSVPPELRGKNDESEFRALVSCLTEDGDHVVVRNVVTEGFPATESGNSFIHTRIQLPNPCVAPIVMVLAGSEDKWFAMNGFEAEESAKTPSGPR